MDLVDCAPDGAVKGTRRRQSGEAENAKVVEQRRLAAQWAKNNLGVKPGKTAEVCTLSHKQCPVNVASPSNMHQHSAAIEMVMLCYV